jgi:hypothetical protein
MCLRSHVICNMQCCSLGDADEARACTEPTLSMAWQKKAQGIFSLTFPRTYAELEQDPVTERRKSHA